MTLAKKQVQLVVNRVESLSFSPERGRIGPELNLPHIREIIIKKLRIVYKVTDSMVEIVLIHHSSMDFARKSIDKT